MSFQLFAQSFSDPQVGGTIHIEPEIKEKYHDNGILFIFLYPFGKTNEDPLAVFRVRRPKYPQAFVIGPKNAMIPGTVLKGPFSVKVKHSLKEASIEGDDTLKAQTAEAEKIQSGQRDISITFKANVATQESAR